MKSHSDPGPRGDDPDRAEPDVFEVAGADEDSGDEAVPIAPIARPAPRRRPGPEDEDRRARRAAEESARVDQVWSRGAEWGPTIIVLAVVGLAGAALVYLTFSVENLGLSFLILMVAAAAWIVLTYPIVITLERPVRITPEQAVKDYYAALSHHLPHYRRMWLLLSSAGRTSTHFGSFEGFKGYWKHRLAELKAGRASGSTPLVFQVEEFKAEKSAGKTFVEAKFKVAVSVRGRQAGGPIETIRVESGLVKGPDNMWYLNRGTLPDRAG